MNRAEPRMKPVGIEANPPFGVRLLSSGTAPKVESGGGGAPSKRPI